MGCPGVADIYSPRSGNAAVVSTRDRSPVQTNKSGGGVTNALPRSDKPGILARTSQLAYDQIDLATHLRKAKVDLPLRLC